MVKVIKKKEKKKGIKITEPVGRGTRGGISSSRTGEFIRPLQTSKTRGRRVGDPGVSVQAPKGTTPLGPETGEGLKSVMRDRERAEAQAKPVQKIEEARAFGPQQTGLPTPPTEDTAFQTFQKGEEGVGEIVKRSAQGIAIGVGAVGIAGIAGAATTAAIASRRFAAIQRTADLFGKSFGSIEKLVLKKELGQSLNNIVRGTSALKLSKLVVPVVGAVASADILFQWYALDNVITGQKFFMLNVRDAVAEGTLSSEEAINAVEESKEIRQVAITKIEKSNSLNPLMWPFRRLILAGVEGDNAAIDIVEQEIRDLSTAQEAPVLKEVES